MHNRILELILGFAMALPCLAFADSPPVDPTDGQIFITANDTWQVFDAEQNAWVTPDEFWQNFADRKGGLTWGTRRDYPEYAKVKEFDTLLLETDDGTCLLMFFHTRWRRANDVRRWHDKFNDYSACPKVFD